MMEVDELQPETNKISGLEAVKCARDVIERVEGNDMALAKAFYSLTLIAERNNTLTELPK